jgi:hypothetical protein
MSFVNVNQIEDAHTAFETRSQLAFEPLLDHPEDQGRGREGFRALPGFASPINNQPVLAGQHLSP